MGIFQSRLTLDEQLKQNKRMITRAVRELDRERTKLEVEEKKIVAELKKQAAGNNVTVVKVMAKDLVRTRKYVAKFLAMRSHLQGVQLRMQTVKSTEAMARNLKSTALAMTKVNDTMNLPELTACLQQFQEESEKMGISEDAMGDAIDDALADVDDIEQEENVVSQVLDEIGIDLNQMLARAPKDGVAQSNNAANAKVAVTETANPKNPKNNNPDNNNNNNGPSAGNTGNGNSDDFLKSLESRVNNLRVR